MARRLLQSPIYRTVVEAYRLDRYDNFISVGNTIGALVVEAYRLNRYNNKNPHIALTMWGFRIYIMM